MTRTHSYLSLHRTLIMGLCAALCIALCAYVSLTVATIFETAGKTKALAHASTLTSHISELQTSYFILSNTITAAEAASRGFVAPKKVTLAPLRSSGAVLSISTR